MIGNNTNMYDEACKRMRALGIDEKIIERFHCNRRPVSILPNGMIGEISKEQKRACDALISEEWEEWETECIVYLLAHSEEHSCSVEYVLFVENHPDTWGDFYKDIEDLPFITLYAFYPLQGYGKFADGLFIIGENGVPIVINLDAANTTKDDCPFY